MDFYNLFVFWLEDVVMDVLVALSEITPDFY